MSILDHGDWKRGNILHSQDSLWSATLKYDLDSCYLGERRVSAGALWKNGLT